MTDSKQLMEVAKNFSELAKAIESGEVTLDEFRQAKDEIMEPIKGSIEIIGRIIDGEDVPEIDEFQLISIRETIAIEAKKYDLEDHKSTLKIVFKMLSKIDEKIGDPIFSDMMTEIMLEVAPLVGKFTPEGEAMMVKQVKKFKKKIEK
jgi:hypothetical protein